MKTIRIVKQFVLTHNNMTRQQFAPGVYELEDDIADHPYVLQHSDKPPSRIPQPGSVQAKTEAITKEQRKRLLAAALAEASEDEIKEVMAEQKETVRRRVVTDATRPPVRE